MSERRPHWDDDLILSVAIAHDQMHMPTENATSWTAGCYRESLLYPLIAAVEDWAQDRAEVERLTEALADRDRRIEAALVLHWDRHDAFDDRYIDCGACNRPAPCPTVQALRGESDE